MDWDKAASYLESFSERAGLDAESFRERDQVKYADQIQRKKIYAEIAFMLAGAIRAGLKT